MHGIYGTAQGWVATANLISSMHPGTLVVPVPIYEEKHSLERLEIQVQALASFIRGRVAQDPARFQDGYHLVCHSQGALICRCAVQTMDDHMVRSLISLAGPQMGVYGPVSDWTRSLLQGHGSFTFSTDPQFVYAPFVQRLSVAEMWNDPMAQNRFLHDNKFLPLYNGLTDDRHISKRRANFIRLEKAIFLSGVFADRAGDGGIEPSRSGVFSYYRENSTTDYVDMRQQRIYVEDTFGLRTLDERGNLLCEAIPDVGHNDWLYDNKLVQMWVAYLT